MSKVVITNSSLHGHLEYNNGKRLLTLLLIDSQQTGSFNGILYIYTYHISPQKVAFIVKQLPNLWSSHEAALDPSGIPRVGLPEENHIYI